MIFVKKNLLVYLKYIFPVLLILAIVWQKEYTPMGHDSKLYLGLAQKLVENKPYTDTIRNDDILPPIGHPLILSFFIKTGIDSEKAGSILLFLSFLLFYGLCVLFKFPYILQLFLIFLFNLFLPPFIILSVEFSLMFFVLLLLFSLSIHFKERNNLSGILLGVSIFLFTIVRPLFMPLIFLLFPFFIYLTIKNSMFRKNTSAGLLLMYFLLLMISLVSQNKYNDNRILSGTYSSIPLFCANNEFINTGDVYYSTRWRNIARYDEAVSYLRKKFPEEKWQERDSRMKNYVINYVLNYPIEAIVNHIKRIYYYTLDVGKLFFAWLLAFIILVKYRFQSDQKNVLLEILPFVLTVYIVLISSIFVYAGERYKLLVILFYFHNIIYFYSFFYNNINKFFLQFFNKK